MKKLIRLREYETLGYRHGDKTVEKEEWEAIRDYVIHNKDNGKMLMQIESRTLKAQNYVGIIQTHRGTTIEILPKIDLRSEASTASEQEIFLDMLRCLRNNHRREMGNADIRTLRNFPLLEAFIAMFLKDLLALTHQGLARTYNEVEENRYFLKGKLLLTEQLRYNHVHKERFYVRYEEFSANRPINRLLKSTLLRLDRLSRSETNLSRIRQARFYFDEIPESHNIAADLALVQTDRTMSLYARLIPWVRLFLKNTNPVTYQGRNPAIALLFPMERIFEDYVADRLRRGARRETPQTWRVTAQERPHWLIQKNPEGKREFQLRPDIVMRDRKNNRLLILDAKWKRLDTNHQHSKISQSDLYQLYAYGRKYHQKENGRVPTLYLLYPRNQNFTEPLRFHYDDSLHLTVFPVDLTDRNAGLLQDLIRSEHAAGPADQSEANAMPA